MPEKFPGEWARKSHNALLAILFAAHKPGHPTPHITAGDAQDPEIRSHETTAFFSSGGTLEISVEWDDFGPFVWIGQVGTDGILHRDLWASNPEDQKSNHSWDRIDEAVNIVRAWLDAHTVAPLRDNVRDALELKQPGK